MWQICGIIQCKGSMVCRPNSTCRTQTLIFPAIRVVTCRQLRAQSLSRNGPQPKLSCPMLCFFLQGQPTYHDWLMRGTKSELPCLNLGTSLRGNPHSDFGGIGCSLVAITSQLNFTFCPVLLSSLTCKCCFPKHILIKFLHTYFHLCLLRNQI